MASLETIYIPPTKMDSVGCIYMLEHTYTYIQVSYGTKIIKEKEAIDLRMVGDAGESGRKNTSEELEGGRGAGE